MRCRGQTGTDKKGNHILFGKGICINPFKGEVIVGYWHPEGGLRGNSLFITTLKI